MQMGGIVVGAFLIFNADLLMTYMRFMREMERLKANNKQFTGSLQLKSRRLSRASRSTATSRSTICRRS